MFIRTLLTVVISLPGADSRRAIRKNTSAHDGISLAKRTASTFGLLTCLGLAAMAWAFGVGAVFFVGTRIDHPSPQAGAEFGGAAGIGDVNGDGVPDFVVTASGQDVSGNAGQGQAYVFSGADLSVLHTLDLPDQVEPPISKANAGFAGAVAAAGDVDHDGVTDIIVGASLLEVDGLLFTGQAIVFSGATGAVLLTLNNPDPQPIMNFGLIFDGFFGGAVAGMGDVNGDGYPDLAVGASAHLRLGVVYIFSGIDGGLLLTLDNPLPGVSSNFGRALTGVGDVSGDGLPDLLVGTPGRVFLFNGDGTLLQTIENPDPGFFNVFGLAIATGGDINGDGVSDFIIGDPSGGGGFKFFPNGDLDLEALAPGQVFVLSGLDGSLLLAIKNPQPGIFPGFGAAVASAGDVDGDGVPDLWVGAVEQGVGRRGRAHLFGGADGRLLLTIDSPEPQFIAFFGIVAPVGDITGDGISDLVVSAPGQDVGGNSDQGQAFLFLSGDFDITAEIDISPGKIPNAVNPNSNGSVTVAVLATDSLDVTAIDLSTVRFGVLNAFEIHGKLHLEDVNGDGRLDAVFHFTISDTGISVGDLSACVRGNTSDGVSFSGCDAIKIVP